MDYSVVYSRILQIFIVLCLGFAAGRLKLVSEKASKEFSGVLLELIVPVNIFYSMLMDFNADLLVSGLLLIVVNFLACVLTYGIGLLTVRGLKIRKENEAPFLFDTMFSNAVFIGFPVAMALWGREGLFLASMMSMVQTFLFFTWGEWIIRRRGAAKRDEGPRKFSLRKDVFTNINIAILLGLTCFLAGIRLPAFLEGTVTEMAKVTTPLSLIVIGLNLSKGEIGKRLLARDGLILSALRLLILPVLIFFLIRLMPFDAAYPRVAQVTLVLLSMPAPAMSLILCEKYDNNPEIASLMVFQSTLLSMGTIPLVLLLL